MRVLSLVVVAILTIAAVVGARTTDQTDGHEDLSAEQRQGSTRVSVVVRHRVIASFADTLEVVCGTGDLAWIGDTEYSLEVVRFLPDFGINESGDIVEQSGEAHNPASEVVIYRDGVEEDRLWSFFGSGAPHFRRNSILSVEMIAVSWHGVDLKAPIPRKAE